MEIKNYLTILKLFTTHIYLPNTSTMIRIKTKSIFKQSTAGLNSKFIFEPSYRKESILPYNFIHSLVGFNGMLTCLGYFMLRGL